MAKRMYKYEIILAYLKEHGEITSWQIIHECRTAYPSKIIQQIREKGYKIDNEPSGKVYDIFVFRGEQQLELKL